MTPTPLATAPLPKLRIRTFGKIVTGVTDILKCPTKNAIHKNENENKTYLEKPGKDFTLFFRKVHNLPNENLQKYTAK